MSTLYQLRFVGVRILAYTDFFMQVFFSMYSIWGYVGG